MPLVAHALVPRDLSSVLILVARDLCSVLIVVDVCVVIVEVTVSDES